LLVAAVDLPPKIRLPTSRHAAACSLLGCGFLPPLRLIWSFSGHFGSDQAGLHGQRRGPDDRVPRTQARSGFALCANLRKLAWPSQAKRQCFHRYPEILLIKETLPLTGFIAMAYNFSHQRARCVR